MSVLLETGMSAPPVATSRADRFLARVDAALPGMRSIERVIFIERLIETWEQRYSAFVKSGGKSEHCADPHSPIHAADFTLTLAGLAARRAAIAKPA